MRMKKIVASTVVAGALFAAGAALASPAWSAPEMEACGLGADAPYWVRPGTIHGTGGRFDCGGSVTLTVRVAKDILFRPDPISGEVSSAGFTNGTLGTDGACFGNALYYTWTISSSGNQLESGRVQTC